MLRRYGVRAAMLFTLAALTSGQMCGAPAPAGGGGGGGAGNLVGVWRAVYNDPLVGPTTVELVLQPNGNFSETYTSAGTLTYISGPYFVDLGQAGLLRLTVHDWYPKEFLGTPILPVAGESWLYTFIDNNNLVLTNANCTNLDVPGCVLNHVRVN